MGAPAARPENSTGADCRRIVRSSIACPRSRRTHPIRLPRHGDSTDRYVPAHITHRVGCVIDSEPLIGDYLILTNPLTKPRNLIMPASFIVITACVLTFPQTVPQQFVAPTQSAK